MEKRIFIRVFLRCIQRFGPIKGSILGANLLRAKEESLVSMPGYKEPILVRGGTSDVETFEKIFLAREYDTFQESAETIIDLGANVGYAALFFANKYPNSQIISVEPEQSNYDQLCRNVRMYPNITPVKSAIWHRKGWVKVTNPDAEKWIIQVAETDENDPERIEAISMHEILDMVDDKQIDILKIDIESAEKEMFTFGYKEWIDKINMMVIELHDNIRPHCGYAFYTALTNYCFNQYIAGENIFVVFERDGVAAVAAD